MEGKEEEEEEEKDEGGAGVLRFRPDGFSACLRRRRSACCKLSSLKGLMINNQL